MPVVTFSYQELVRLVGEDPGPDRLGGLVSSMGSDIVRIDRNELEVEFFPNRPDLYSVEGLARALRNYMGCTTTPQYDIVDSGVQLFIDESVKYIRPYMVAGIARGLKFDDNLIKSIMQAQEKLHGSIGRGRRKVAIGVHDMAKIEPPFYYRGGDPETSFIPLGRKQKMSLQNILEKHERGMEYAHILHGASRYPLFVDSKEDVLSFPPIINGILTEVTHSTTDVLLDVTGTDLRAVEDVLNILMTLFYERGAKLESVQIIDKTPRQTPDLSPKKMNLDRSYANRLLGLELSPEEMASLLAKMGHTLCDDDKTQVCIPPYRSDLLHPVDIVEDIAIAYGYRKFQPVLPDNFTPGMEMPESRLKRRLRRFMVGLGFVETVTFTLIGLDDQYTKMRLPVEEGCITNPLTIQTNSLRTWLVPSLIQTLATNKHRDLPQKLFELDDVVVGSENETHLAGTIISSKTGFTEIKGHAQAILDAMGMKMEVSHTDHPSFITGRCAAIEVDGLNIGFMGEIHPEALTNFNLVYPVTAFEINMDKIFLQHAEVAKPGSQRRP